ncbi:MAG: heavy-metal-associated domain-containing protein [Ramlibacter sp.]
MIAFEVNDMTCGHCVGTITKAVKAVDKDATVRVDLGSHRVEIDGTTTGAPALGDAITQAGYTPVAIEGAAQPAPVAAKKSGGCCCG